MMYAALPDAGRPSARTIMPATVHHRDCMLNFPTLSASAPGMIRPKILFQVRKKAARLRKGKDGPGGVQNSEKVAGKARAHAVCDGLHFDEVDGDEEAHEEQEGCDGQKDEARVCEWLEKDLEPERAGPGWQP